jgi:hypothetical protein
MVLGLAPVEFLAYLVCPLARPVPRLTGCVLHGSLEPPSGLRLLRSLHFSGFCCLSYPFGISWILGTRPLPVSSGPVVLLLLLTCLL